MAEIRGRRWVGHVRGARAGTAFYAEGDSDAHLSIGLPDGQHADFQGERKPGSPLMLSREHGTLAPAIEITWELDTDGLRRGVWKFAGGGQGIIDLVPVKDAGSATPQDEGAVAPQFWNTTTNLGAITLYREDLERVIAEIESHVAEPRVTRIRAREGGGDVFDDAASYLARKDLPEKLTNVSISCERDVGNGLKNVIVVNLYDDGSSQLVVSSPSELWTLAASAKTEQYLGQYTSSLLGWVRKNGLNVNFIGLLILLIWLPGQPLYFRVLGVVAFLIVMLIITKSHSLIPYTRVYLSPSETKRPFAKEVPAFIAAAILSLLATILAKAPDLIDQVIMFFDKVQQ